MRPPSGQWSRLPRQQSEKDFLSTRKSFVAFPVIRLESSYASSHAIKHLIDPLSCLSWSLGLKHCIGQDRKTEEELKLKLKGKAEKGEENTIRAR